MLEGDQAPTKQKEDASKQKESTKNNGSGDAQDKTGMMGYNHYHSYSFLT